MVFYGKLVYLWVLLYGILAVDPLIKDLLTPVSELGERCGYDSCFPVREGWINVHIVPHTHAELGYMKTFDDYYTGHDDVYAPAMINMKRVFDATISELWADKFRKFTMSDSELPYFFHWWARRDGTVRRMVLELIRQGRLVVVGGGWGMNDEASTSYQSIIDSYTYSLRKINATFLSCGRPRVAWQADTFGHSREYASLVALMGFDGLFINPISFDDELIRMERKALEFVWRGSDDLGAETDIYTHKLFDGYWSPPGFCFGSMCSDPLLVTSDSLFKNVDERIELFVEMIRYRQSPYYNTKHVMVMMGQRMGYFDAKLWFANIDKLITNFNARTYKSGEKMHAIYSNPACYLRAVYEDNPILETKQDDFFPFAYNKNSYTTGAYTSRPTFKYLVRESNIFLQMAKQLQVLMNLDNNDELFEHFNWIMGVAQDHNIISGAMRLYAWSYYTERIHIAVQWASEVFENAFNKIRGSPPTTEYRMCRFNTSSCPNTYMDRFYITVYNPLAWSVTMPVRLPIRDNPYDVFDPAGKKINAIIIKIPNHIHKIPNRKPAVTNELVFIAHNIPALGMRSYFIEKRGILRIKKSLIKKISKKQQKYFIRQAPKENRSIFEEDQEYDEFEDNKQETKIEFGNVDKPEEINDYEVVTPKYKVENQTANMFSEIEITTSRNVTPNIEDEIAIVESTSATVSTIDNATESMFSSISDANVSESLTFKSWIDENVTEVEKDGNIVDRNEIDYYAKESKDNFIRNKYIQINLDEHRKVTSMNLSNGIKTILDIQYYYYVSDEPGTMNSTKRNPGAYIFRSADVKPDPIMDFIDTKVYKSGIVDEIHTRYSDYASFALKLYTDRPVVEVDWVIGPVPIEDTYGKEVFIRYTTDLVNDGAFYTDANMRQMMKRIRNVRAMYDPYNLDPIAGNFYPVTSRIYIEDLNKNLRFSIFNDRSQGGASLLEGSIDMMIHRRIFTDDSNVQAFLNETEFGVGIIVRGTHYLYLTKADSKQNRVYEKRFAKEIELKPQMLVNKISQAIYKDVWMRFHNEYSALKGKLPIGIHLLTIQEWNDKSLLLRLENYLEKVDVVKTGNKRVFLKDLFVNIKPLSAVETTLAGNILLKDHVPLVWRKNGSFFRNFNEFYGPNGNIEYADEEMKVVEDIDLDAGVTLVPQQIRTLVIQYEYVKNRNDNEDSS